MGVFDALLQSVGLGLVSQVPMHVSSLCIYPVKGCRGCEVSEGIVETTGVTLRTFCTCALSVFDTLSALQGLRMIGTG